MGGAEEKSSGGGASAKIRAWGQRSDKVIVYQRDLGMGQQDDLTVRV